MKDFKSLFGKKKKEGKMLSDNEKSAKINVLKDLRSRAADAMGSKLKGLKQGTPGMDQAKSMFDAKAPGDAEAKDDGEEKHEHESSESEMSLEEVEAKIAELTAMKEKLQEQA